MRRLSTHFTFIVILMGAILTGCATPRPPSGTPLPPAGSTPQLTSGPSPTAPPPTPTSEPLAASVDGVGITLAAYQTSLAQLQKADAALKVTETEADQRKRVLDDLVDQTLLAEAAAKDGYQLADSDLQAKLAQLTQERGGEAALQAWETENGYTETSLREALRASLAAAWERDRIVAQVPETAEQIHAQQILVPDEATAQKLLAKLQAGSKFASLAVQYDSVSGGDLGWFPKGYLTVPEVESAAFALQPGQTSEIIHSRLGYHIVQVIERDPQHPLSPDARLILQQAALRKWLDDRRAQSQIQVLVP